VIAEMACVIAEIACGLEDGSSRGARAPLYGARAIRRLIPPLVVMMGGVVEIAGVVRC